MKKFLKKYQVSDRGFSGYQFMDRSGNECSIQDSSLATESAIWFGCNKNSPTHLGHELSPRMHLTQEMVKELLPILTRFAETGEYLE